MLTVAAGSSRAHSWLSLSQRSSSQRATGSRQRRPALRWALVGAAQHAATGGGPLRQTFEQIAKRRGRQVAKVAVARKILTLCFYGLRDGEIRCLAPRAPARTIRPTALSA